MRPGSDLGPFCSPALMTGVHPQHGLRMSASGSNACTRRNVAFLEPSPSVLSTLSGR